METKTRKCNNCNKEYEFVRSTSKFCCASCRASCRNRESLNMRKLGDALLGINDVALYTQTHLAVDKKQLIARIDMIENAIECLRRNLGSKD